MSGAYDSLPHSKLIEVVNRVLTPVLNQIFIIRRFAKIWANSHEGLKKTFIRQVNDRYIHIYIFFNLNWVFKRLILYFILKQADFLQEIMGSVNMKTFVTSLQEKGKIHHSILVEQVRVICSDMFFF